MRTSIEAAIAIATAGTSQTSETFQRRALTTRGCGSSGAAAGAGPPAPPGGFERRRQASLRPSRAFGVAGGSRQIRRGSNDQVASIVRTTTAANDSRPAPALTLASGPKRTVAASRTTT